MDKWTAEDEALLQKAIVTTEELRKNLLKVEKAFHKAYDKMNSLKEKKDSIYIEEMRTNPDWDFLLFENGDAGAARYKAANEILHQLGQGHMVASGYWTATNQRAISISLPKRDSNAFEIVYSGLSILLPHIKEIEGEKRIKIFEDTLSAHGVFHLIVENEIYTIQKTVYHIPENIAEFNNLRDALIYIQKTHSYN